MTSLVGYLTPCRSDGICALSMGKTVDSQEKKMQKPDTNANCMRVRLAGLRKALRIDFEEVLVRALEKYQMIQRICGFSARIPYLKMRFEIRRTNHQFRGDGRLQGISKLMGILREASSPSSYRSESIGQALLPAMRPSSCARLSIPS